MGETIDTGQHLWPAIVLAVYWACLLFWRPQQGEDIKGFLTGLPPPVVPPEHKDREPDPPDEDGRGDRTRADFLERAARAYEYIALMFAAGNLGELAELVSAEVLAEFSRESTRRQANAEKVCLTFAALEQPAILEWKEDDQGVEVKVRFAAEIFVSERDESEPGSARTRLMLAREAWTFKRQHRSPSPIWTLIATDDG